MKKLLVLLIAGQSHGLNGAMLIAFTVFAQPTVISAFCENFACNSRCEKLQLGRIRTVTTDPRNVKKAREGGLF